MPYHPGSGGHVCGLYYLIPGQWHVAERVYLPQVELKAHASIVSTTSRTVLTQTFANPSGSEALKEVKYTFPLYDGVSVVGFTCQIGSRVIVGEVKEKEKARAVYKEAVERGETAGLFEQLPNASDVFTTTVGNIPSGASVVITITYLGELKHDMEVDGIRFTIPTMICPRYGRYPQGLQDNSISNATGTGISITVDAEVAEGSFIQQILSPSHPIAVSMGTSSIAPNTAPSLNKASATLSLGKAELTTDFVLKVIAKDTGVPKAILETHPTLPNQRALMATLVPKFALPPEKPEIVFMCDRSGSMGGSRITLAIQALKVFLKSLPVGAKFNICSFGSRHTFHWPKSVTYSQETLDEAVKHVERFQANYGGTEMLAPLMAAMENRYQDIPLEIMLLTDGEVWDQQQIFSFLDYKVAGKKAPIRVFTLGVGTGVSHALIEGIAKAGNGFSQSVGEGEPMGSKVVRMLKGALSPHVTDYTLEIKYSQNEKSQLDDNDDDFELIEKVANSLQVKLDLKDTKPAIVTNKPISLFDDTANPDQEPEAQQDKTGEARYAHLPLIPVPKIIQAPQNIPSLFAFNRTTIYLLLGPDAPQMTPRSVILRGNSKHGPLELEFPVQILDKPGEMIHQLTAKKAIAELEQGRGWLAEATDGASGRLLKEQYQGRFSDMVEREAVRLGVQFQVGGKWCSFVAVEKVVEKENDQFDVRGLDPNSAALRDYQQQLMLLEQTNPRRLMMAPAIASATGMAPLAQSLNANAPAFAPVAGAGVVKSKHMSTMLQRRAAASSDTDEEDDLDAGDVQEDSADDDDDDGMGSGAHRFLLDASDSDSESISAAPVHTLSADDFLERIISEQTFEGHWALDAPLMKFVGLGEVENAKKKLKDAGLGSLEERVAATCIAVAFLERKMADKMDVWELVVEKARGWLGERLQEGKLGDGVTTVDEVLQRVAMIL